MEIDYSFGFAQLEVTNALLNSNLLHSMFVRCSLKNIITKEGAVNLIQEFKIK